MARSAAECSSREPQCRALKRSRRWFLERLGGAGAGIALGPVLQACGSQPSGRPGGTPPPSSIARQAVVPSPAVPSATASATATDAATARVGPTAIVALVRTTDRAAGVRKAIELLGIDPLRGRRKVLLKPNLNSADEAPGSTHPDVLSSLLQALHDMGARAIVVGDRSGMGDTREVMRRTGVVDLSRELGFETVAFDELPPEALVPVPGDGLHWSRGFVVPELLQSVDAVVQTCNVKTHRYGGHFSLSLKNSVGLAAKLHDGYDYMSELHDSPDQRRMIAEVNTAYAPALVVVDGVQAFVRGGPATGEIADAGVVLAGVDRIAIDAVGVAILRLLGTTAEVERGRVFEQEQIARAVELGLGVTSADKIAFAVGDSASSAYAEQLWAILNA